ncbi:MAG: metallophosphoesterase [Gemmatimonadota bacterium]
MRTRACVATLLGAGLAALAAGCGVPHPSPDVTRITGAPLRAVLISDLNAAYGATAYPAEVHHAVRHITTSWRPDLVLVAGDMVAGQSAGLSDSTVRAMWDAFDAAVAAPLRAAGIPLVVTMGNHDASAYPAHARDRALAAAYWRGTPPPTAPLPFVEREHYPLRYTVARGDVFLVAWDATRQESATDAELLDWLRRSLASPEARRARHRVVLGHLPLYGVAEGRNRPGEVLADGDRLRRQLEAWGATLYISGHHHAYYPGRRGGLELLHAGAVGNGPRQLLGARMPPTRTVSVLDFLPDSLAVTTYAIGAEAGALERISLEDLPPVVCGHSGWVGRRDLPAVDTACAASR